ncbi:hypothetical protein SAMN06295912_108131 [Sphingomonas laterariae]|uniref:Uncharacterized protein n=1 Tax=Edaphosphingomonas laterariae TaxID=861865 RepID=A0A239F9C0_9SPHN|nr:hypothetical protein [Sphingomonas laterariae]SNS53509.1 hypothetical protein SAMN06295912_108131 [Sphingomonas laterariae]
MWWTFQAVQDRLVEAWGFQRAVASVMPAGARASDGPWHLVIRDRADMAEQSLAGHELVSIGRATLRPEEVDRMDEALGWVVHVRADDVRLLALAIGALERSGHRIAWSDIAPRCGLRTKLGHLMGPEALKMRYRRAIKDIAVALNGGNAQLSPSRG